MMVGSLRNLQESVNCSMFYNQDLAYIHDQGFTDLARNAARTVLELLKAEKIRNGLVIDLGCGSGVFAEKLTHAGYDVLGIDISEAMLKMARKRAPLGRFERGSLFRAKLPDCVAVCAIGEGVNYLLDGEGATKLRALFSRVHRALQPGGLFGFDIAGPEHSFKVSLLHSEGEDWAILVHKTGRFWCTRKRTFAEKFLRAE